MTISSVQLFKEIFSIGKGLLCPSFAQPRKLINKSVKKYFAVEYFPFKWTISPTINGYLSSPPKLVSQIIIRRSFDSPSPTNVSNTNCGYATSLFQASRSPNDKKTSPDFPSTPPSMDVAFFHRTRSWKIVLC